MRRSPFYPKSTSVDLVTFFSPHSLFNFRKGILVFHGITSMDKRVVVYMLTCEELSGQIFDPITQLIIPSDY